MLMFTIVGAGNDARDATASRNNFWVAKLIRFGRNLGKSN